MGYDTEMPIAVEFGLSYQSQGFYKKIFAFADAHEATTGVQLSLVMRCSFFMVPMPMPFPRVPQTQKFWTILSGTVEYEEPHGSSESFGKELVFEARQMGVKPGTSRTCHGGRIQYNLNDLNTTNE